MRYYLVEVAEHEQKLKQAKAEYHRAGGYRRRDLGNYTERLQNELRKYNMNHNGTYGKART